MRIFYYLFTFFCLPLLASITEPVRLEYRTGYRNDRLHWHIQNPGEGGQLLYSEVYKNLQFWENTLTLTVYHRDIYFFLEGGGAAFGQGGEVNQRYAHLNYTNNQPRFIFTPQGWALDGTARFGYCVNLTDGRLYKVVLVPFVGYSGHYESLQRKKPRPAFEESSDAIGSDSYTISSQLPGNLQLTWYGFLVGGMFHINPGGRFLFDVGYNYNWLHVRFHTHYANEVAFGAPLNTKESTYSSIKSKASGNLGHTGWAKILCWINKAWQAGLGAQVNYFVSGNVDATEHQSISNANSIKNSEKLKIRWTVVSGWASISRDF